MDLSRRAGLALACVALLLCLGAAAPAAKTPQTPEDLVGSWKLNEDLSQGPHGMHPGGSGRGSWGGGGGRPPGGPRGGGGGGERRSGPPPGGGPGGGEGFRRPPIPPGQVIAMAGGATTLQIQTEGPQITFLYGSDSADNRHLLFTDGRKVKKEQEGSEEVVQRTRWRDEHLEIETTAGHAKVTELWLLTNDRKRIFATVEMDMPGGRGKMTFRRVWDRVEGGQGEAPPA